MSMQDLSRISGARQQRALWLSTFALAVCFAVWVIFSIVGIQLQQDLGLSGTQFGLLVAAPILTGSISRPGHGSWAEVSGAPPVHALLLLELGRAWGGDRVCECGS